MNLEVKVGVVGPPDTSDVLIKVDISDVRCQAGTTACGNANAVDGADYTGELEIFAGTQRASDHWNAVAPGGGPDAATVIDEAAFPVGGIEVMCAPTPDTSAGSDCTADTSANTIVPGAIKTGKRTNVEMIGSAFVFDGGPDGLNGTTPNTPFATEGVFVP